MNMSRARFALGILAGCLLALGVVAIAWVSTAGFGQPLIISANPAAVTAAQTTEAATVTETYTSTVTAAVTSSSSLSYPAAQTSNTIGLTSNITNPLGVKALPTFGPAEQVADIGSVAHQSPWISTLLLVPVLVALLVALALRKVMTERTAAGSDA